MRTTTLLKTIHGISDLKPQVVLSKTSRERCIKNLKTVSSIMYGDEPPKRKAAVLAPLCVVDGKVNILYTLRSSNLNSHSGQVAFPGGMTDDGETALETALRETNEELGIGRDGVEVWTEMSPFQGANHLILITPLLGVIRNLDLKHLKPNLCEVKEVFTVPLQHFCEPGVQGHTVFNNIILPVYTYKNYKIWGVTGYITHIILSNLLPENVYKNHLRNKKYNLQEMLQWKL